jgi:hypothetical protein
MLRLAAVVFSGWVLLSGCAGPTDSYSKPGSRIWTGPSARLH